MFLLKFVNYKTTNERAEEGRGMLVIAISRVGSGSKKLYEKQSCSSFQNVKTFYDMILGRYDPNRSYHIGQIGRAQTYSCLSSRCFTKMKTTSSLLATKQ